MCITICSIYNNIFCDQLLSLSADVCELMMPACVDDMDGGPSKKKRALFYGNFFWGVNIL